MVLPWTRGGDAHPHKHTRCAAWGAGAEAIEARERGPVMLTTHTRGSVIARRESNAEQDEDGDRKPRE